MKLFSGKERRNGNNDILVALLAFCKSTSRRQHSSQLRRYRIHIPQGLPQKPPSNLVLLFFIRMGRSTTSSSAALHPGHSYARN